MYLLDTKVFLELLLEQEKAEEIKNLLLEIEPKDLYITDFSLYSVGITLLRLKKQEIFLKFIKDVFIDTRMNIVRLMPIEMESLIKTAENFKLDFEDTYQYLVAEKYNLILISLDSDFAKTERKRKMPAEILQPRK